MEKKRMKQPRTYQRSCNGILVKTLFLLLLFCVSSWTVSSSWAQDNRHITLKTSNMPLGDVIKELSKQTGKDFLYSNQEVNIERKLSLALDKQELKAVLPLVFGANFDFEIKEKVVIIRPSLAKGNKAQQAAKRLTGKVVNESNVPMPGVTVHIKGTSIGVVTDDLGLFEIAAPTTPKALITVSFLGMKTEEITYKGENNLRVVMREDVGDLDKVVVTGVFTKSRESYTGAVTIITAEEMQRAGSRSILSSIRNIDPSFNIVEDNTMGSNPNSLPDITMRGRSSMTSSIRDAQTTTTGTSQPLFIQDGFEISLTRMMDLDENQIESITLLKDASATVMYGTRGANGVVVIVTKKPESGAITITYKGGINIEAPDFTSYNLMNAKEKLLYEQAAGLYIPFSSEGRPSEGVEAQQLLNLFNSRWAEAERGVDTYWLKYPVRTGVGHNHSLRLEGKEGAVGYSAGISYKKTEGAMKGSDRGTFNGEMLLSYRHKKFIFQNRLQISHNKSHESPYGTFHDYSKINSYWKPYDDNGNMLLKLDDRTYSSISNDYNRKNEVYNPLYNTRFKGIDESKYTQIKNNFDIEWSLNSNLKLRGRLGITSQTNRSDKFKSPNHTDFSLYIGDDVKRRGTYTVSWGETFGYESDIIADYRKVFNDVHQLYVGASVNIAESTNERYTIIGEGIADDNASFLGLANAYAKDGRPYGNEDVSRRVGGKFNVNYTYDLRYFVDFSGTMEASSKFGSNNRTAPFWSAGAGWNIHRERFLEDNKILNLARLRVSYGITGSQNFDPYQAMRTFKYFEIENYNGASSISMMGIGNSDLGWQKTKHLNVGTELEFFDKRISLKVDVYNKLTDALLADISLPPSGGFSSYKANIGEVSNKGVEMSLNAYIFRDTERQIYWSVGGNIVHNKNEIKKIASSLELLNESLIKKDGRNPSFLFKEGESMGTIFAVKSLGIDPSSGKEVFVKNDGTMTHIYDDADRAPCGVKEPKWQGVLNTFVSYKNLSLSAFFGFNWGGQMYNQTLADKVENIRPIDNADKRVLYDRWKKPGDISMFKDVADYSVTDATSRFVADNNVFECRSIMLSYDLRNNEWLKRNLSMSSLRISINTEDVFRISSIKLERGLSYPYARKFSLSLTARF